MRVLIAAALFLYSLVAAHAQTLSPGDRARPRINLAGPKIFGNLPVTNLNSGAGASVNTFWRGDGTWALAGLPAGITSTNTGNLTYALGTITTNLTAISITGTFNNAATTFDAPFKMNITNTASATASKQIDLQVGGNSYFWSTTDGSIHIQQQTSSVDTSAFIAGASPGGGGIASALVVTGFGTAGITVNNQMSFPNFGGLIKWGGGPTLIGENSDAQIALRAGTTAQTLRVYNTFTDASNYERGVFDWTTTANTLTIGTQNAGTGAARSIALVAASGLTLTSSNTNVTIQAAAGNSAIFTPSAVDIIGSVGIQFDSPRSGLSTQATSVVGFSDGNANNTNGWMQWAGQKRVTSDFTVTSSTVLTNVTGLSVNVQAGRIYNFQSELYVTDAAAGGVQAAIAGTATATAIQYTGYTIADNAIKGKTNATALATAVGSTTTTETTGIVVRITGTITVNAAGTLTVQMAQNTSNATATTAKQGSYLLVQDMP